MKWLFATPTRAIEAFSCILMLGFALALIVDDRMLALPDYRGFTDRWYLVIGFAAVGVICLQCLLRKTKHSLFCSGYSMILAALGWAAVGAQFGLSYPPLTLGQVAYTILSLFSLLAGLYNLKQSSKERGDGSMGHP